MAPSLGLSDELLAALAYQGPLFVILVLLGALVATGEFALFGLSTLRRRQLAEEKHPGIGRVERVLARPRRLLVTILVTRRLINVSAAVTAALFAWRASGGWGVTIAVGAVTVILLTVSDLIPRAYAARHAETLALRLAPLFLVLEVTLWPVWWVFEKLADLVFRVAGVRAEGVARQLRSEEELRTLITLGAEEGFLEADEQEMIQSVIELGGTTAKDVMVPRVDMIAVPADATLEVIKPYVLESGFSRIPVYEGNMDNVIGVLYVKDMLLRLVESKGQSHVRSLMREPLFVPEAARVDDLLGEMRERRTHIAVVVDEFGGTAGLVTLEDLLEEIVGEIFDEYDLRHDPVRKLDEATAVVDARTHVSDVNDALDIEIPEDEGFDTVAGFVQHQLGRHAREGERVHGDGFDVVIEKATPRRILRARIEKHEASAAEAVDG